MISKNNLEVKRPHPHTQEA